VFLKKFIKILLLKTFAFISIYAQEVSVSIEPERVQLGGNLQITLSIKNDQIKNYSSFPEINGFIKGGISSSSSTNFINGKMSSSQSIIQNYISQEEGTFIIPDFDIEINKKKINVKGKSILVEKSTGTNRNNPLNNFFDPFDDPFDNFFDRNNDEFYEVEADAFLSLTTDKKDIFVGEGFNTTLAFYVSESNVADMRFYELGRQLTEILKKIKPGNCWEENFNIENINSIPVEINNKRYNQYKIFQATYYPFNDEPINFPSLDLELIKYKVSKRPSFFGRNKIEDYEKFYSKPVSVNVKKLPYHPLKDNVVVGNFKLRESIDSERIETGNSFNYIFEIVGEGNISAIDEPSINLNNIDFYPPNSEQIINRERGKVFGSKKYSYYGIPNEPGKYDFSKKINWIFFNSQLKDYDTLKSETIINSYGDKKKKNIIVNKESKSFIEFIQGQSNELKENKKHLLNSNFLSIIIITLVIITSTFIIYNRNG
tara:strand:- start:1996 stop:3453 length:1458 start_codon:yes stop_codon:yes gene_type:complete